MLQPTTILKLSEFAYWTTDAITENIVYHLEETEFRPFVKWKQVQCYPSLYNGTTDVTPESVIKFINREFKISNFPQPITNKSQEVISVLQDIATEDILISTRVVLLNVNTARRRSESYKDEVKKIFCEENCEPGPIIYNEIPKMCQKIYETPQDVLHVKSDPVNARQIDYNQHTNQGHLIEFPFDCLAEAILRNKLPGLSSIFNQRIERMTLLFVKESSFGERLDTSLWRDNSDRLSFKFHIKRDEELICQAEISLF